MIAMVDPIPYNSNTFKDTCNSFDYELQKTCNSPSLESRNQNPTYSILHAVPHMQNVQQLDPAIEWHQLDVFNQEPKSFPLMQGRMTHKSLQRGVIWSCDTG